MVLSRSKESFAKRLTINKKLVKKAQEIVHLGVWISEDMSWDKNTSEI